MAISPLESSSKKNDDLINKNTYTAFFYAFYTSRFLTSKGGCF